MLPSVLGERAKRRGYGRKIMARGRWRRRAWLGGLGLALMLAASGVGLWTWQRAKLTDAAFRATSRAEELGIPLEADGLRREAVPAEQNAAPFVLALHQALRARGGPGALLTALGAGGAPLADRRPVLGQEAPTLRLLDAIAARPVLALPRDLNQGPRQRALELRSLGAAGSVLELRARLEAQDGDEVSARRDLDRLVTLSDRVAQEPSPMALRTAAQLRNTAVLGAARIGAESDLSVSSLSRWADWVGRVPRLALVPALRGEVVSVMALLRNPDRLGEVEDATSETVRAIQGLDDAPLVGLQTAGLPRRDAWLAEYVSYLNVLSERWTPVTRTEPARGGEAAERAVRQWHAAWSEREGGRELPELVTRSMTVSSRAWLRSVALQRLSETYLRLLAYRARSGAWPGSLSEVGPVRTDPWSAEPGKGLGYRRVGDGFWLWSVGEDGVDDGGANEVERRSMGMGGNANGTPTFDVRLQYPWPRDVLRTQDRFMAQPTL